MAYKPGRGGADYMYDRERDRDRDRKSFDRESLESYESANRRRRSFGSGNDVYGSLDSREDYRGERDRDRERDREQMKTRSLRKPTTTSGKLRISGDIDYEQDSEQDFQQRPGVRSLQRPSQLGGDVGLPSSAAGGSQRLRKSSGSSPWDGEGKFSNRSFWQTSRWNLRFRTHFAGPKVMEASSQCCGNGEASGRKS